MIAENAPLQERVTVVSTVVAVPAILALLSAIQLHVQQRATEFLVLPPLAVITYLAFRHPSAVWADPRSIILLPVLGALCGEVCSHLFGFTPLGLAIASLVVLALQLVLRASMPPAIALAILAMLLRAQGWTYVLGVLEATVLIFVLFELWRRLVFLRIAGGAS